MYRNVNHQSYYKEEADETTRLCLSRARSLRSLALLLLYLSNGCFCLDDLMKYIWKEWKKTKGSFMEATYHSCIVISHVPQMAISLRVLVIRCRRTDKAILQKSEDRGK